jgi:hypothetical protein
MSRAVRMMLMASVAVLCCMGISCKKDQPTQPPSQPGHTAITFQATFTSIRWCRLQWSNDSTAPSHHYLLLRDRRDTVYNDSMAVGTSVKILQDTMLKPGTSYSYWIYRIVNGQRWDSATVDVRTLDTTRNVYSWNLFRIGNQGSAIYGCWGNSTSSLWLCGQILDGTYPCGAARFDRDTVAYIHVPIEFYGCHGLSDSDVWFAEENGLNHWNGTHFEDHVFNGDSLPNLVPVQFMCVWESPNGREVFGGGTNGRMVRRRGDGVTWDTMVSGTWLTIMSIDGRNETDVYAVTERPSCSGCEGEILHYDGVAWQRVGHGMLPPSSDTNLLVGDFSGVSGNSRDTMYAVGQRAYVGSQTHWSLAPIPGNERNTTNGLAKMIGVTAPAWNDVWIVGYFGLILHFDGERWTSSFPFFNYSTDKVFNRCCVRADEVFVVGGDHQSGIVIHGR